MGTRADFYVGRGMNAEWIGSYGYDGYPDGIPMPIRAAKNEGDYRAAVEAWAQAKGDRFTRPAEGWPWPWDDGHLTDYSYAFEAGQVWGTNWGYSWWPADKEQPDEPEAGNVAGSRKVDMPDMRSRKKVTWDSNKGAPLIFRSR